MSFFKAVTTIGGFTLVSRFLGLARDILTAGFLGAGPITDAFFIALKLPNFFRKITAEGAFSVSFIPLFSKKLENKNGDKSAKEFAEEAQAIMFAIILPFTIVAIVLMPWILYVVAPGIYHDTLRFDYALQFSRITFPYILMISLTALLGGVLNSINRFAAFAIAPIIFNLTLIAALIFGGHFFETRALALSYGVFIAGIIQFLWMFYNAWKSGFALKLKLPKITPSMRKLYKLMIPGMVGAGALQINLFIDMILASLLPIGSISFLYYADRLYQLPLGVIGIAIGTALLPMLSRALKLNDGSSDKLFGRAFEAALALSLPAAIGLIILSKPILAVLFERGSFDALDTIQVSYALRAYSIGLPAYVLSKIFSIAYFAREDTKTPVKFSMICVVINIILALLFIIPFKHAGIAFATGITAWVNLTLLIYGLYKRDNLNLPINSTKRVLKIVVSAALMAIVLYIMQNFVFNILETKDFMSRAVKLGIIIFSAMIFYFLCLYWAGIFNLLSIKTLFPKAKKQPIINDINSGAE